MNELQWIESNAMPDFDGQYLCHIVRKNECGTFSKYQSVVECKMNKWVVKENERITHFMIVPSPERTVHLI